MATELGAEQKLKPTWNSTRLQMGALWGRHSDVILKILNTCQFPKSGSFT